jgi:tRNA threonylcarbamoyladenosine biosynthesis protein TsaB
VRVVGFDTSTAATTAAILDEPAGIALSLRDDPPRRARPGHTALLMAQVVELLEQTGTRWNEVDRIAVGVGPGTFTGLRIGVATARALGAARGVPLSGISSLEALALGIASAGEPDPGYVLVAIDARRGEAFVAAWRTEDRRLAERVVAPVAAGPESLAQLVQKLAAPVLAAGSGALEFRSVLEHAGAVVPDPDAQVHRVDAICHCRLALVAPAQPLTEIVPEYLRPADAELARRVNPADQ